jgi:hypothetical protein
MNNLDYEQNYQDRKKMSGCQKVAIGCFILTIILCLTCGFGIWWVTANLRTVGTNMTRAMLKLGIKEMKLPDDQQSRIFDRIDNVSKQFREEKISFEKLERIFQKLGESPLFPASSALLVERVYLDQSGLGDDEKEAGKLAIRRFARGSLEQSISEQRNGEVLDIISVWNPETKNREFLEDLNDQQLRDFIAEAKRAADEAGVVENIPKINFADEFDRVIDQALAEEPKKT